MKRKLVPEFEMRGEPTRRAGFIPSYDEGVVEVWQLWCRTAEGEDAHRATFAELRKAGFVRRKSVREREAADKPARRK